MKFTPPRAVHSAAALMANARAAEAQGRLGDAEAFCAKVLVKQPQNIEAEIMLSDIASRTGRHALTKHLLRSLLARQPGCVGALMRLVQLLRNAKEQDEAAELCRRTIAFAPRDADAHFLMGICLMDLWLLPEAIKEFEEAIACRPDFGPAHDLLGRANQLEGRGAESATAYRQAIELMPNHPSSYVNLGHLFLSQGANDEARAAFAEAERLASGSVDHLLSLARAHRQAGDADREEAALRRVIEASPIALGPRLRLGQALQEAGKFNEALRVFRAMLAFHPGEAMLYHELVYSGKITEADRSLIESVERLLERSANNPSACISLHYALGKAFDDLAQYETAMHHFHLANQISRSERNEASPDRGVLSETIDTLISTFTLKFFETCTGHGSDAEEPVFILGMPRSGTSLTEQILSNHPDVAAVGEFAYLWAHGIPLVRAKRPIEVNEARELAQGYLRRVRAMTHGERRITDKVPDNYMLAGLIHQLFPNARIIHCRRNPIDTCLSTYFMPINTGYSNSLPDIAFAYREYMRLMEHWREVLPPARFFEFDYEELVADPEPCERQLIEFLGLPWDAAVLQHETNDRVVKTPSKWQVRQPVNTKSVGRRRCYEPWIGELLGEFPEFQPRTSNGAKR